MLFEISAQSLVKWRDEAKTAAKKVGVDLQEVDWLLVEMGVDPLILRLGAYPSRDLQLRLTLTQLNELWEKRLQERVPIQYLVGRTPWRNFLLKVSPQVLIPRPETEYIIDLAVAAVEGQGKDFSGGDWVDLGTGSGAIAIALCDLFPTATIHAVDLSPEALSIAQENAQNCNLATKIKFYQGSWWQPLHKLRGKVSGMVSNPPYIPSAILPQLQPEVFQHEPHRALDGGEDGLGCIRHLIATAPEYLRPGGIWLIEMMSGQAEAITELLAQDSRYTNIEIFPDLAGIERFALAFLK